MTCPDIYINPFYWTTPHPAEYGNLAIDVGPGGTEFVQGVLRTLQVSVRNHGTIDAPSSLLQLYWADPSTTFTMAVQIDSDKFVAPVGGDGAGTDGIAAQNFAFTPDATAVGTNGGHVCLLAHVSNAASPMPPCTPQGHTGFPLAATDARSAIRNIHVYAPPPSPKRREMFFGFAASNNRRVIEQTKLVVRPLDPQKDREQLETLVTDRAVYETLVKRCAKFALPKDWAVVEGRERVVLPRPYVVIKAGAETNIPRIGRLGPISEESAEALRLPGTKFARLEHGLEMDLAPGEMRQTILRVVPSDDMGAAHAMKIEHLGADGAAMGGLIVIFVKPHDFFG